VGRLAVQVREVDRADAHHGREEPALEHGEGHLDVLPLLYTMFPMLGPSPGAM